MLVCFTPFRFNAPVTLYATYLRRPILCATLLGWFFFCIYLSPFFSRRYIVFFIYAPLIYAHNF
jgi:hypothetical protein